MAGSVIVIFEVAGVPSTSSSAKTPTAAIKSLSSRAASGASIAGAGVVSVTSDPIYRVNPSLCSAAQLSTPWRDEPMVVSAGADQFNTLPLGQVQLKATVRVLGTVSKVSTRWVQHGTSFGVLGSKVTVTEGAHSFPVSRNGFTEVTAVATISGTFVEGRYLFELHGTAGSLSASDNVSVVVAQPDSHARSRARTLLDLHATWLDNNTRNCLPLIINEQGVSANSIHVEIGRGGYFPTETGTSEGQFAMIRANGMAHRATNASHYLDRALFMADALEPVFYGRDVPVANDTRPWAAHWLVNAKNDFQSKGPVGAKPTCATGANTCNYQNDGAFEELVNFTRGVGYIRHGPSEPGKQYHNGERTAGVFTAYEIRGGALNWQNIFSGVAGDTVSHAIHYFVDQTGAVSFASYNLNATTHPVDWSNRTPGRVVLTEKSFSGQLKVVYNTFSGPVDSSSLVRFLPVSQHLLELAFCAWVLECGVLTSREA